MGEPGLVIGEPGFPAVGGRGGVLTWEAEEEAAGADGGEEGVGVGCGEEEGGVGRGFFEGF